MALSSMQKTANLDVFSDEAQEAVNELAELSQNQESINEKAKPAEVVDKPEIVPSPQNHPRMCGMSLCRKQSIHRCTKRHRG